MILRGWLRARPYTALATLALAVVSLVFLLKADDEWEHVYLGAAANLRAGRYLYRQADGYLYPPFMAWASVPFTLLPRRIDLAAWLVVNLVCLIAVFRWSWRLAGGGPLEGSAPAAWREHCAALLGAACGLAYLQNCLAHRQTDVVLAALLLGGCRLLSARRALAAATCFGIAAAMKCTALLWAPYLAWRRRPGAAGLVLGCALGLNFLPDLLCPAPYSHPWLLEYGRCWLKPLIAADHYVGDWKSDRVYNQSLAGAANRWLLTTWTWAPGEVAVQDRPDPLSPATLRLILWSAEALLVLAALTVMGRSSERTDVRARAPLEYAAVLALTPLLSPMSSKAHFGVLLLPGLVLARAAVSRPDRLSRSLLAAAVVCAVLAHKDLLGPRLYTLTLWYGSVTWQTLLLFTGCLVLLTRTEQASVDRVNRSPPPPPGVPPGAACSRPAYPDCAA
jgi:hypothetical protein